ncbi:MAG: hypothetical protein MUF72_08855 [Elainella sp. Prado103]|jgi:hypothetical protein|nr:hypothetical protein [Elainella sp. Prado103]
MKSSITWKSPHWSQQAPPGQPLPTASHATSMGTRWQNGWKYLKATLFATQPEVWQASDRQGRMAWYLYCPTDEKLHQFDSENEVRIWLERQYSV